MTITNLELLAAACAAATAVSNAEDAECAASNEREDRERVMSAAKSRFGEAADALGEWQFSAEDINDETLIMLVTITPSVFLRYTAVLDQTDIFELVSTCGLCGESREARVPNAASLASALQLMGVLQ